MEHMCIHKNIQHIIYIYISYLVSAPHIYKIYGPGGTADHIYIYIYIYGPVSCVPTPPLVGRGLNE